MTRMPVTGFLPAGPMPSRSTSSPLSGLAGDGGHGEQGHAQEAHSEGLGEDEQRADPAGQDVHRREGPAADGGKDPGQAGAARAAGPAKSGSSGPGLC